MKITVGFSTTKAIYSRIIRWFTNSPISHVYIRVYNETFGTDLILHSDMPGTIISLAEAFDITNFTTETYEIEDERLKEAIKDNLWHLGKGYHYFKLVDWSLFIILKRWLVRKVKKPITNPKKLICVDFVLFILNEAGITHLPIGLMTPHDLLMWCRENFEKLGWKRKVFDDTPDWLKGVA